MVEKKADSPKSLHIYFVAFICKNFIFFILNIVQNETRITETVPNIMYFIL